MNRSGAPAEKVETITSKETARKVDELFNQFSG